MQGIQSLSDLEVRSRNVLVRVDFNVPLRPDSEERTSDGDIEISDDTRMRAALPTIEALVAQSARVILISHLGRPKGQADPALSLEPVAKHLASLLPAGEVLFAEDCIGENARLVVDNLRDGQVAMLENLRFYSEEEANDEAFAKQLRGLAEVYVNDAFGTVHRAHASVAALPRLFESRGAGLLLTDELRALSTLRDNPAKPYVALLGGAKVSDKIGVIERLLTQVDDLLVGGAMANTFLAAQGKPMGRSLVESEKLPLARSILQKAQDQGVDLVLPQDLVVAEDPKAADGTVCASGAVPDDRMALDIGPKTIADYAQRCALAATVFWNGPMGLFEAKPFARGTQQLAGQLADGRGYRVIGGGDSVAAVQQAGLADRFSHVSTGGGASLEWIEGKRLPGVEALRYVID